MEKVRYILSRLYLFEKLAIAYAVFSLVFMKLLGLKFSYLGLRLAYLENYFYYEIFVSVVMGYAMLLAYMFYHAGKTVLAPGEAGDAPRGTFSGRIRSAAVRTAAFMRENYFNAAFVGDSLRLIVTVVVILVLFCNLKQVIPLVNAKLFDKEMWDLDRALHFGISPTLAGIRLLGSGAISRALDGIYVTFFAMNIIMPLVFILQRKSRSLRDRFFTAFCLCWITGGLSYYIFPAMGPCYYRPEVFAGLDTPMAIKLQEILLVNYVNIKNNPAGYLAGNFYGIAAMPSLHIAQIALFAIFAGRLNIMLAAALWVYLLLMYAGSILLGWHYAIDDYAGVLLAVIMYFAAVRLIREPQ